MKKKVAVGMSGGVDSSVAAALLKKQGYQVIGIFMNFWKDPHYAENQTIANKCCSLDAYNDARRVAENLNLPLYTFNFQTTFKKYIVDNFLKQYEHGLTPNPCVRCNQFIKFGEFWQKAKALGCDFIATGHYAQIKKDKKGIHLLEAKDKAKDQSYFLYSLDKKILRHIVFPVGKLTKSQVRKLATKFKLPVSEKKDSQEICFVPEKEHYEFLKRHLKLKAGDIVSVDGKKLGQHQGLPLYTIGQRKGLELSGGPWYVVDLDIKKNQLIITNNPQDPQLFSDIIYIKEINWLQKIKLPSNLEIRIRYMHKGEKGVLSLKNKNIYQVKFPKKQRAITPGQSAVFYKNREVLGGGIIMKATKTK
ncbi:MAG TPA: tRNA 2-thiouridine(34) synthase MnmA [Candidatus Uhrbacteria bacterium]|nr:tRNA 2-thiouridine(34) synthase MnmA [Candidatus Uhrbacteria bacterium]